MEFRSEEVDREFGYAEDVGLNAMRVFLHMYPFENNKIAFLDNLERYLNIADKHGIRTIFVFLTTVGMVMIGSLPLSPLEADIMADGLNALLQRIESLIIIPDSGLTYRRLLDNTKMMAGFLPGGYGMSRKTAARRTNLLIRISLRI